MQSIVLQPPYVPATKQSLFREPINGDINAAINAEEVPVNVAKIDAWEPRPVRMSVSLSQVNAVLTYNRHADVQPRASFAQVDVCA